MFKKKKRNLIKTYLIILEQSRRDDLESIGYVLVYFIKGTLPWQGLKASNKKDKYDRIKEKKISVTIEELCEGIPGIFFYLIFKLFKCGCISLNKTKKRFLILSKITNYEKQSLYLNCILEEFSLYLKYCRLLKFEDRPDYCWLKRLFKDLFFKEEKDWDLIFDWNKLV